MVMTVKCPTCKKETAWEENRFRPFCSERCKLIDFSKWLDQKYAIEVFDPEDDDPKIN
ncbi:DNA gyrase inhibitor YacG [bacterium]|nr:MAG: DNA gyrase inhibitor YacG [bacterium]